MKYVYRTDKISDTFLVLSMTNINEGESYRHQQKPKRAIHVSLNSQWNQGTIGYAVEDKQQINKL